MPDPQQILADPNFHELPLGERLKVMRTVDPDFAALPPKEQGTVLYESAVKFHPIAADTVPTDKGFWSTIGSDIAALPGGIYNSARHPLDTLANATDARLALRPKAEQAAKEGHPVQAAGYRLASAMPFVGPAAAQAGEELGGGQPGQGAAHATELLAPFAAKGVSEIPQAKAGVRAVGKVVKSRITGKPIEGAPTTPSLPGPYFNERSTIDPQMHGTTPPAGPPTSTGTVNVPPVTPPEPPGVNTRGPAGKVNPAARTTGTPPTGTMNVPPTPQPTGMTQNARGPLVSPVATKPPSQVFVGSSGTIPGEVVRETPAAAPEVSPNDATAMDLHGKPYAKLSQGQKDEVALYQAMTKKPETTATPEASPAGKLNKPTTPESYTKKALDQIVSKAEKADLDKHQNEFHVGDVSEHKALNVARYLNEQGVSADAYQKILDTAKQTGDWSPVDRINKAAYDSGKAGAYPGYLPENGYTTVSNARRVQRANYQGTTTPQRVIEHLKELDKLRK